MRIFIDFKLLASSLLAIVTGLIWLLIALIDMDFATLPTPIGVGLLLCWISFGFAPSNAKWRPLIGAILLNMLAFGTARMGLSILCSPGISLARKLTACSLIDGPILGFMLATLFALGEGVWIIFSRRKQNPSPTE